jgi:PIN domain nuclease of toxin-antitoxin system
MIVLDTHAWLWWVSDPSRLSRAAHRKIRTATQIGISAISCLEVATAVTKGRITLDRGAGLVGTGFVLA